MISQRAKSIDTSGIRRVFNLGAKLKDPINLSIGQPDFDAWPPLREAAKRAIDSQKSGYTVTQGIEPLRERLRTKYQLAAGTGEFDRDVFITCGVSGALTLAYMAMCDPGDEILIPDPFFCIYRDVLSLINAVPAYYDCYPDFHLKIDQIERAITPKTKAILVNSPSNPTGISLTQAELDAVVELAKARDLWLIYDEIYDIFNYDGPHAQLGSDYEKTLIINGFSKSFGVPGWRLGYAVGPNILLQEMMKIQQYTFVCAPSISQYAALDGFDIDFSEKVAEYRRKRDFIFEQLSQKFEVEKPSGAFYIFPKAPGDSAAKFVERCIEKNLLVIPAGGVFSQRDTHFRISFAAPMEKLEQGVEVLNSLAG